MILASAQTNPDQKDIFSNLKDHYQLIKIAADNGVQLIVFPEMSITGYIREGANECSFSASDIRLEILQKLAVDNKMIIVAGAPLKIGPRLFIGSLILSPDGSTSFYTKQYLHPGEEVYFQSSMIYDPVVEIENEKISLAICADIDNPLHTECAFQKHSSFYMPSIFFSKNGIPEAHTILSEYSKKYSLNILMSNFCGRSWNTVAGGRSAFWNSEGVLISSLDDTNPGLLIVEKVGDFWSGRTIQSW
jgi:predicted amidohydrolase